MQRAERFAHLSVALAATSTLLYWAAYANKQHITSERRASLAAASRPIVLNGFRPTLLGVSPDANALGTSDIGKDGNRRLLFVVSDTCAGCGLVVPQWMEWIAGAPKTGYSVVVVSAEGST
jgi:hypothetical protein